MLFDNEHLIKEVENTLASSKEGTGYCICMKWILKDILELLKEQGKPIVHCEDCKYGIHTKSGGEEVIKCMASEYEGTYEYHPHKWYRADGKFSEQEELDVI